MSPTDISRSRYRDRDTGDGDVSRLILDTALPQWPLPLSSTVNPAAAQAIARTVAWQESLGLIASNTPWNSLIGLRPVELAARGYPRADLDTLTLASEWTAWFFHIDDLFDEGVTGTDIELSQLATGTLRTLLHNPRSRNKKNHCGLPGPATDALLDLLRRTREIMTPVQFRRFISHLTDYAEALAAEAVNRVARAVLDVDSYCALRRNTGPALPLLDLIENSEGIRLPTNFYISPEYEQLLNITADVASWINDLFSVEKEEARGDCHNFLLVVKRANGGTITDTVGTVIKLIREHLGRFEGIVAALVAVPGSRQWPNVSQIAISRWIAGLRSFLCHSSWYIGHARYRTVAATPD
jgi:hypothetical protein